MNQPHNNFFEAMLTKKSIMADFLEAHLPQTIYNHFDWPTLRFEKDTYIDPDLIEKRSDVLVSVAFREKQTRVNFLVEHQSTSDALMPLRLQEYIISIQRHGIKSESYLPFIYPIIYFTGKRFWPYPIHIRELMSIDVQQLFAEQLADTVQFIDLNRLDDERLDHHKSATVVEKVLKYGPQCDILTTLEKAKIGLKRYVDHRSDIKTILSYLSKVCKREEGDVEIAQAWLRKHLGNLGEKAMISIAEEFKQEGVEIGIVKGRQEGVIIGEQKLIKAMLKRGYSAQAIEQMTGISVEEIQALEQEELL